MAIFSLVMKIVYLTLEALKFRSTTFNFHIIFPIVVDGKKKCCSILLTSNSLSTFYNMIQSCCMIGITLIALSFSPKLLKKEVFNDQENEEILKLCKGKPIYLPPLKKKKHA